MLDRILIVRLQKTGSVKRSIAQLENVHGFQRFLSGNDLVVTAYRTNFIDCLREIVQRTLVIQCACHALAGERSLQYRLNSFQGIQRLAGFNSLPKIAN